MSGRVDEGARFRGQPLVLLGAVVLGWGALRVATWESPFPLSPESPAMAASTPHARDLAAQPAGPLSGADPTPTAGAEPHTTDSGAGGWLRRPLPAEGPARPVWNGPLAPAPGAAPAAERAPLAGSRGLTVSAANGHALLLVAGLSGMELPAEMVAMLRGAHAPTPPLLARRGAAAPSSAQARAQTGSAPRAASADVPVSAPAGLVPAIGARRASRWAADAWLLLREDSTGQLPVAPQSYGRSQAGAVLRYRLAPASGLAPQAHLRASTALDGGANAVREREVAAGLSARPIPRLPVRLAAELRAADLAGGTQVRPAAYAVTELPPVALPLGARGELYLQGGWVGGAYETAFVDGQARVDRPLARLGPAELSAGGAMWGGAQRGAARLDVGPSLSATIGLGRARARISADYRFRVAGDAEPGSGPALTIYAGF